MLGILETNKPKILNISSKILLIMNLRTAILGTLVVGTLTIGGLIDRIGAQVKTVEKVDTSVQPIAIPPPRTGYLLGKFMEHTSRLELDDGSTMEVKHWYSGNSLPETLSQPGDQYLIGGLTGYNWGRLIN